MKKLVLIFAVAFGASMVSCGGQKAETAVEENPEAVEVVEAAVVAEADSACCDSAACDSVAAEVVEAVAE